MSEGTPAEPQAARIPGPPPEVLDLQRHAYRAPAVLVAMDEEAQPFLDAARAVVGPVDFGRARYWGLEHDGRALMLVRTGIGLVNAATAATTSITLTDPAALFSAGSAGGLRADVEVGDVVVGPAYAFADADATAFGYVRGQIPGLPEVFEADPHLLELAESAAVPNGARRLTGPMLSGNSFVMAHNVQDTREIFPQAVSTDMESAAIAQVCTGLGTPFLAVRGISDLCGPAADQDFHLAVDIVAERSARVVLELLGPAPSLPRDQGRPGPRA